MAFLDFEQDEYTKEVAEEVLFALRELVLRCKTPRIILEVLRRVHNIAEGFNSKWKSAGPVRQVCQVVEKAMTQSSGKKSKVYQSGLALLKDLSSYKALKENKLNREPLGVIRKLRGARDEVDYPGAKRLHLDENQYIDLMERLADTADIQEVLSIEEQIKEMGYEPNVQ